MKHTYLYVTENWQAAGTYYDESGNAFPLSGEVALVRKEYDKDGGKNGNAWSLDGFMEVGFPVPVRFTNTYAIEHTDQESTLKWESFNPALGMLRGTFEIIEDSIISRYESENGVYSGTETLLWRDDKTYYNAGVSFQNGKKMSSWTANLTAAGAAEPSARQTILAYVDAINGPGRRLRNTVQ